MGTAGIFQRNIQWNFSLRKRWRAPFSVTFIRYCQLYFEIRWTDKLQIGVNDILVTRKSLLDLVGVVCTILVEGILIWEILLQWSLYLESVTTFCNKIFSLFSKFVAFYLSFVIYSLAITKPTLQSCLCSTVHDEFHFLCCRFLSGIFRHEILSAFFLNDVHKCTRLLSTNTDQNIPKIPNTERMMRRDVQHLEFNMERNEGLETKNITLWGN